MIEYLIPLFIGIFFGIITGLTPGIHTNLVSATLVASLALFSNIPTSSLIIFIVALAVTNTFVDFIPSIYLGAPEEDTALSTMPGHQMLMYGDGHKAVVLTLIGGVIAVFSLIIITPLFILLIPKIYPFIERMMGWFLIIISILLILNEKNSKVGATIIFILSGFLGIASLNSSVEEPLLPLLTGLFGSSTLIYSIKSKTIIPEQMINKIKINKKELIKPTITTMIVSPICSFLPGLGSSQAAIIGSQITKNQTREQFLILLGSINTLVVSVSFITLFLIQKARTGAASAISQVTILSNQDVIIMILTIILTTIIVFPISIWMSKIFAKNINKIDYTKISFVTLIFITIITFYFAGIFGILIFITSTILGLTCIELNIRKGFLMGCLLIPTILFYLPF